MKMLGILESNNDSFGKKRVKTIHEPSSCVSQLFVQLHLTNSSLDINSLFTQEINLQQFTHEIVIYSHLIYWLPKLIFQHSRDRQVTKLER